MSRPRASNDHDTPLKCEEPDWSDELRDLVDVLIQTLELLPRGVDLLERVCGGPRVAASELPPVPPALRKPPTAADGDQDVLPEM